MTEEEADERIENLMINRQLSMLPKARQARLDAYEAGRDWFMEHGAYLQVRENAEREHPDNAELQYEYVLGAAQALNNLARDIGKVDYRDAMQPEGKKR